MTDDGIKVRNSLPFAMTPEWLLDAPVSSHALRLYAILARYADRDQHAHPSRRKLAERCFVSVKTVDRALKELVVAGALRVENRHDENGDLTTNEYILTPGRDTGDATPGQQSPYGRDTGDATVGTPVTHEREPVEREPVEREKTLAPRKRDAIWDVLVEMYGEPTASGRGARNAACKVLRDYGADPDEVRAFVAVIAGSDRDWSVATPSALAKHYGERNALMAQVLNGRKKHDQAADLLRQAMAE